MLEEPICLHKNAEIQRTDFSKLKSILFYVYVYKTSQSNRNMCNRKILIQKDHHHIHHLQVVEAFSQAGEHWK